jgi:hypothetical protein
MFKLFLRSVMLAGVSVAAGLMLPRLVGRPWRMPAATPTGPTIEQVRELSALVTTSVDVADVQVTELRGWTGGVRVALLVKGQYLLGTDLSQSRFESVNQSKNAAELILLPPTATCARLDHERTKLYAVNSFGLWAILPTERAEVVAVDAALRDAQASVAAATGNGPSEKARRHAELVLGAFFREIGWQVTISWSDRL